MTQKWVIFYYLMRLMSTWGASNQHDSASAKTGAWPFLARRCYSSWNYLMLLSCAVVLDTLVPTYPRLPRPVTLRLAGEDGDGDHHHSRSRPTILHQILLQLISELRVWCMETSHHDVPQFLIEDLVARFNHRLVCNLSICHSIVITYHLQSHHPRWRCSTAPLFKIRLNLKRRFKRTQNM